MRKRGRGGEREREREREIDSVSTKVVQPLKFRCEGLEFRMRVERVDG